MLLVARLEKEKHVSGSLRRKKNKKGEQLSLMQRNTAYFCVCEMPSACL